MLYTITTEPNRPPTIRCHLCGKASERVSDIENHYCGNCHKFLDDEEGYQLAGLRLEVARLGQRLAWTNAALVVVATAGALVSLMQFYLIRRIIGILEKLPL
jgi:hypothetical protein